ncbi:MAG: universal stress protein [bacterium]|nr:MAG: universal stress protein [bacterium]
MSLVDFNKILCPVDFSKLSDYALKHAIKLCELFDAKLFILHIAPHVRYSRTSYYDGDHESDFKKLCDTIPSTVKFHSETIKNDDVDNGIIKYANANKIDLIVIGTQGHSGIERFFLGSTTEECIRKAPCPVMVVRELDHKS